MFSKFSQFVFGSSSLRGKQDRSWKFKESGLHFDLRQQCLELDQGELLLGCFVPIEDVKGNPEEWGMLKVTNLRLIWISCKPKRLNISIGWRTVEMVYEQNLKDELGFAVSSLFLVTRYELQKYEFVFRQSSREDINENSQRNAKLESYFNANRLIRSDLSPIDLLDPFEVVFKVWQAYRQTKLFRDCHWNLINLVQNYRNGNAEKGNSNLFRDSIRLDCVNRLAGEEIREVFVDVERVDFQLVGTLILSNIRMIWIDQTIKEQNLSIPYLRVTSIKLKDRNRKVVVSVEDTNSGSHPNGVEFSALGNSKENKSTSCLVIFEAIQKQYTEATPLFGPESRTDCLVYMSYLRPFDRLDGLGASGQPSIRDIRPLLDAVDDDNKEINILSTAKEQPSQSGTHKSNIEEIEAEVDRADDEIGNYMTRVNRYLNDQLVKGDEELVYSTELGLAIERPANGASIDRIWRIEF